MAVLELLVYPDERLKQASTPVNEFDVELARFVADLEETLQAAPGCVGLAAPQVNYFKRVVIVDVSSKPNIKHHEQLVLVNPVIVDAQGEIIGREGCLSVPDYTGNVPRARQIGLRAQNVRGETFELSCEGYEARAVLHEIDHLDGILFLDRLISKRDLFRRKVYR